MRPGIDLAIGVDHLSHCKSAYICPQRPTYGFILHDKTLEGDATYTAPLKLYRRQPRCYFRWNSTTSYTTYWPFPGPLCFSARGVELGQQLNGSLNYFSDHSSAYMTLTREVKQ
jgi:hypothetical protein